ncbi:class I SAM-dependent methyltransferase [Haloterrigena salifodinae]|uniref:Class I SAM-dependent methyltransferase n=1 Tax=Haloterrigena salifodinae TaxID=2675099 RepID=A0A8T8E086_9EURY|nr:class I SAM-dependent methyltransferase [Haloterrigena salifodinae]QRV14923.1 class I SAM-dependent methyltransferase [Haloterrigena salifodinae]
MTDRPMHGVLAALGKRVLRPGGRALTQQFLEALAITPADDVVEFAPGAGATARRALAYEPNSYTGIELDRAAARALRDDLGGTGREIVVGNAADTDLADGVADVVYGEAMLSMQPDEGKAALVGEARRLLRTTGVYGIHELAIDPDGPDAATESAVRDDLSHASRVNARPLTESEWVALLEDAGFTVRWRATAPMRLLEPRRVVADEGLVRTLQIAYNVLTDPEARNRVRSMRRVFNAYNDQLRAIAIVAEKTDA